MSEGVYTNKNVEARSSNICPSLTFRLNIFAAYLPVIQSYGSCSPRSSNKNTIYRCDFMLYCVSSIIIIFYY